MTNLPGYLKQKRIGFIADNMRNETASVSRLLVYGLTAAIIITIFIVMVEHQQHQYLGEVIRGALRDYFAWFDTWKH